MRFNDRSELQRSLDANAAFITVNCHVLDARHKRVIEREMVDVSRVAGILGLWRNLVGKRLHESATITGPRRNDNGLSLFRHERVISEAGLSRRL